MKGNKAPSEAEICQARYKVRYDRPNISDCYKNIEIVTVEVMDAYNKEQIGKMYSYTKEMKASFYLDCNFSQCNGFRKGFEFGDIVNSMTDNHTESHTTTFNCGGYGDVSMQYHCDIFFKVRVTIRYLNTSECHQ